jgi:hypothetical protein
VSNGLHLSVAESHTASQSTITTFLSLSRINYQQEVQPAANLIVVASVEERSKGLNLTERLFSADAVAMPLKLFQVHFSHFSPKL